MTTTCEHRLERPSRYVDGWLYCPGCKRYRRDPDT